MNTLVVYDSKFGNTERVARAIAERLQRHGAVELITADRAPLTMPRASGRITAASFLG
jgi:flavodoxin